MHTHTHNSWPRRQNFWHIAQGNKIAKFPGIGFERIPNSWRPKRHPALLYACMYVCIHVCVYTHMGLWNFRILWIFFRENTPIREHHPSLFDTCVHEYVCVCVCTECMDVCILLRLVCYIVEYACLPAYCILGAWATWDVCLQLTQGFENPHKYVGDFLILHTVLLHMVQGIRFACVYVHFCEAWSRVCTTTGSYDYHYVVTMHKYILCNTQMLSANLAAFSNRDEGHLLFTPGLQNTHEYGRNFPHYNNIITHYVVIRTNMRSISAHRSLKCCVWCTV